MGVTRGLTAFIGFVGWLYSWSLIRAIRRDFSFGLGRMPLWLMVLMGIASTLLIAAGLSAAMRAASWPALAASGGIFLFLLVVLGQLAVMQAAPGIEDPSFSQAFHAAIRVRSPISAGLFVIALPAALVVFGLAGLSLRSRSANADKERT